MLTPVLFHLHRQLDGTGQRQLRVTVHTERGASYHGVAITGASVDDDGATVTLHVPGQDGELLPRHVVTGSSIVAVTYD